MARKFKTMDGNNAAAYVSYAFTEVAGIYPITPVDATGAGDSFDAAFLCGLVDGKPMMDCIRQATSAASLNTAAFGPMEGKISPETVAELIAQNPQVG